MVTNTRVTRGTQADSFRQAIQTLDPAVYIKY